MLKMLKYGLSVAVAGLVVACIGLDQAGAQDRPPSDDFGRFLGLTVRCSCVSGGDDYAFPVYHAYLADRYDTTYAEQAMGHMKLALHDAYDNQVVICGRVCNHDSIPYWQELLDEAPYLIWRA